MNVIRRAAQDRIDRGLQPGPNWHDNVTIVAANKRIQQLKRELAVARRAVEPIKESPEPKSSARP